MNRTQFLITVVFLLASFSSAAAAPQPADGDCPHAVVFYSGRGDNKDVYILHPGEKEPRNLTNHPAADLCPAPSPDGSDPVRLTHDPAWDGWASYVPSRKPE